MGYFGPVQKVYKYVLSSPTVPSPSHTNAVTEATFSVGEYVFVEPDVKDKPKWHDALSPTLHERWTARVLDCRAIDASRVYLLVFWLNRPEDHTTLQGRVVGRQPHHGFNELIATNRPDIIDAST
jgi:hypothetical protein